VSDNDFDFGAFMASAANPAPEIVREEMRDAVGDVMSETMAEVGPRLWCMIQEQMKACDGDAVKLNAVVNSLIMATFAWVAAVTPKGQTNERDNDEILKEKVLANLATALDSGRDSGANLSFMAYNVGKLKLMEDALQGLSNTLVTNSMIIKGIHAEMKRKPDS